MLCKIHKTLIMQSTNPNSYRTNTEIEKDTNMKIYLAKSEFSWRQILRCCHISKPVSTNNCCCCCVVWICGIGSSRWIDDWIIVISNMVVRKMLWRAALLFIVDWLNVEHLPLFIFSLALLSSSLTSSSSSFFSSSSSRLVCHWQFDCWTVPSWWWGWCLHRPVKKCRLSQVSASSSLRPGLPCCYVTSAWPGHNDSDMVANVMVLIAML